MVIFSPKRLPVIYTPMMQLLREDLIILFQEKINLITLDQQPSNILSDYRIIIVNIRSL